MSRPLSGDGFAGGGGWTIIGNGVAVTMATRLAELTGELEEVED